MILEMEGWTVKDYRRSLEHFARMAENHPEVQESDVYSDAVKMVQDGLNQICGHEHHERAFDGAAGSGEICSDCGMAMCWMCLNAMPYETPGVREVCSHYCHKEMERHYE